MRSCWWGEPHPWFWLFVLTVAAATIHTSQAIVFFNGIPGDLADARLVNCILEHVYQALRGYTVLFSPSEFYPVRGTLVYSDTHFGTVLVYAALRFAGASMESAFQGWFLFVAAGNTAALLYLFRKLEIAPWIAGPLAFFGTSSAALVFKTGHPQVMPFFAFVIALSFFLQFLRKADARALGWAILWFGYQHACYFYHGYFAVLIFGSILALFVIGVARRAWWRDVLASSRVHRVWLATTLVITLALLIAVYYPYVQFSSRYGTRPMEELVSLAPDVGAWFSASPFSLLYSKQNFYRPHGNIGESTLFASWLVWLPLIGASVAFFRRRSTHPDVRLAGALAIGTVLLMAALTTWHGSNGSLYLFCADRIASIRALRAFSRIGYLLIVVESVVAALIFNRVFRQAPRTWHRGCVVALSFLISLEAIAIGQRHYSKESTRQRTAALIDMWRAAGARDILVLAPGYTNQSLEALHTDCWNAALLLHKWSVNGYSGNIPQPFAPFLAAPTLENAKALLKLYDVPLDQVSLVTDWEPAARARLGILSFQLPGPIFLFAAIERLTLAPGEEIEIPVTLDFRGTAELPCDKLNIFASYRAYDDAGQPVARPSSLRTRVHTVRPGVSPFMMRIMAPEQPGQYDVKLSMVHEGVAWWADLGLTGSAFKLTVSSEKPQPATR